MLKRLVSPLEVKAVKKKGSILIIALWSLSLLAVFAVVLSYGVRQKIILVQRLEQRDKLRLIAEAGVKKAIVELKKGSQEAYDSLNSGWSSNISAFKNIEVGDGKFSIRYNYIDQSSGFPQTRYGLVDEERKLNINKTDQSTLRRLFRIVINSDEVEAQELAASIIDWRDSDSELSIPLGSAEDYDYQSFRYPYEAKDAEFEVLEELLLVKGITAEIFEKLKNYLTVYGSGKININTAKKEIFLALGLKEETADKILSFRRGEDGIPGTSDDNIFNAPSGIVPELSRFYRLSLSEIAQISVIADHNLSANSSNFMIKSVAWLNNRKNKTEIICVVDRSGSILYWQE